jgi:hypothetical protein
MAAASSWKKPGIAPAAGPVAGPAAAHCGGAAAFGLGGVIGDVVCSCAKVGRICWKWWCAHTRASLGSMM